MNVGIRFGLKIVVAQVVKSLSNQTSIEKIITTTITNKKVYNQQNIKIPNHNYILRYTKERKKKREKRRKIDRYLGH